MTEKIAHIKNPLTIIAIFAGLAEVGGTVVLPLLAADVQKTYVWFLMIFPILLVSIFFLVLYRRHYVLYAPSDYRDDSSFNALLTTATAAQRIRKIKEDSDGIGARVEAVQVGQDISIENTQNPQPNQLSTAGFYVLEDLIFAKLETEFGSKVTRGATERGRDAFYDGIIQTVANDIIIETKFLKKLRTPGEQLRVAVDRIRQFHERLSLADKRRFRVLLIIVSDDEDPKRRGEFERWVENYAKEFLIKLDVRFFTQKALLDEIPRA